MAMSQNSLTGKKMPATGWVLPVAGLAWLSMETWR
jgi:hypothetical protein